MYPYQKSPQPTAPPQYGQPPPPAPYDQYAMGIPHVSASAAPAEWSTGICGCCSDFPQCCVTCWCPCITFGQIGEIVDKGSTSCAVHGAIYALIALTTGCGCVYSCTYRTKLRAQYNLPERPCGDCLLHCCCELCALCQEYRELKNHGFDMSLGWQGNMERQSGGVAMAPVFPVGMSR